MEVRPPPRHLLDPGLIPAARARQVSETELAQLTRIPLPVLRHLDVQVQVDPGAEQGFDAATRDGATGNLAGAADPRRVAYALGW